MGKQDGEDRKLKWTRTEKRMIEETKSVGLYPSMSNLAIREKETGRIKRQYLQVWLLNQYCPPPPPPRDPSHQKKEETPPRVCQWLSFQQRRSHLKLKRRIRTARNWVSRIWAPKIWVSGTSPKKRRTRTWMYAAKWRKTKENMNRIHSWCPNFFLYLIHHSLTYHISIWRSSWIFARLCPT